MTPSIDIVIGLGFGDEGKGSIVDWLARQGREPPLVVRWNGGPQAAHHVVTDDGRSHCFAQLGAASFVDGARTHLGPDMAVDPYALRVEARVLERAGVPSPLAGVTIDPRAVLVTPWHAIVNRVRETLRGAGRHGTTGRGVAEAKLGSIAVRAGQIGPGLAAAVEELRRALAATAAELAGASTEAQALARHAEDRHLVDLFLDAADAAGGCLSSEPPRAARVILEGAQGALLDRDHGFFPHVTPSRITRAAADVALADLGLDGPRLVWGVLRAYHTRHGEGPFPSEDASLTALLPERHNDDRGWAGRFRAGWFDAVLARYALSFAGPIDRLVLTCVDRLPEGVIVDAWETPAGRIDDLRAASDRTPLGFAAVPVKVPAKELAREIAARIGPIAIESFGPTAADKR